MGKKGKKKNKGSAATAATPTRADRADKYELYEQAVQSPDVDVEFLHKVYRSNYNRSATILREDFCGTAAISCEWVRSRNGRQAIGVDLDPEPLAWGREHNVAKLPEEKRSLVELIEGDVREVNGQPADIICAQNFSYFCFKTRDELRRYFEAAYRHLDDQGVLFMDVMGGAETLEEDREEVRKLKGGARYVWHQRSFDPISNECRYSIHFLFKDGSALYDAFSYEWRHWSIPEIRELLAEAGFHRSDVYWEGTDEETGEGDGVYRKCKVAESDPAWVACIAAIK